MPKYLDGIQEIEDSIKEFKLIANGTVSVGTNQYPVSSLITRPSKIHRNYILIVKNSTGQTINSANVYGRTTGAGDILPNSAIGASIGLKTINFSPTLPNTSASTIDITSEEPNPFSVGNLSFQFNLAAAPTSGTIDWALIGY